MLALLYAERDPDVLASSLTVRVTPATRSWLQFSLRKQVLPGALTRQAELVSKTQPHRGAPF
jgi:hypothetical protein